MTNTNGNRTMYPMMSKYNRMCKEERKSSTEGM